MKARNPGNTVVATNPVLSKMGGFQFSVVDFIIILYLNYSCFLQEGGLKKNFKDITLSN